MKFSDFKIFVINLDKRRDRLKLFDIEAKFNMFEYERVSAEEGGARGATLSHLKVAKMARERNLPSYVVCEDDCEFRMDFNRKFSEAYDEAHGFDMLYLGASYNHRFLWEGKTIKRSGGCLAMHCYVVSEQFYDELIAMLEASLTLNTPCDVAVAELHKYNNVYGCFPSIVGQRAGYSDIQGKDVDYSKAIQ